MQAKQDTHARHPLTMNDMIVRALPATAALLTVAIEPATPALPTVPAEPCHPGASLDLSPNSLTMGVVNVKGALPQG